MSKKRSAWRLLYKFHRYAGLSTAIIILMLAVTGIALNHTGALSLDKKYIQSTTILDWYGIDSANIQTSFAVNQHWISQSEQTIYLDTRAIFKTPQTLLGAITNEAWIAVAFDNMLLLLTPDGEVIEQINRDSIEKMGIDKRGNAILQNDSSIYISDDDFFSWQAANPNDVEWSLPSPLPHHLQQSIESSSRGLILPYERVVLDIHSGRFLGAYGVYLVDLATIFFVLIAISGTWIWLRHWLKSQHRAKQ